MPVSYRGRLSDSLGIGMEDILNWMVQIPEQNNTQGLKITEENNWGECDVFVMTSVDGYTYILVFWHKYNKLWALSPASSLYWLLGDSK